MKARLERILSEKSLSANKLAELLEVQPSGISHILSGRNKPSLDFIVKLLSVFPDISPDWFILGKGNMYRKDYKETTKSDVPLATEQQSVLTASEVSMLHSVPDNTSSEITSDLFALAAHTRKTEKITACGHHATPAPAPAMGKTIRRVMIFFSDHTVESFDYNEE